MTMSNNWRYRIGVTLIAIGWICPLFIPLVTNSTLSTEWKTTLSGILLVAAPEGLSLLAIAVLGKDGFNYLKEKVFAILRRAAPSAKVSRARYRAGLAIWIVLFIYGSFVWYAPHLVPGYAEHRNCYEHHRRLSFHCEPFRSRWQFLGEVPCSVCLRCLASL